MSFSAVQILDLSYIYLKLIKLICVKHKNFEAYIVNGQAIVPSLQANSCLQQQAIKKKRGLVLWQCKKHAQKLDGTRVII